MGGCGFRRFTKCGCAAIGIVLSATACLSRDSKGFVSFGAGNRSCDQFIADAQQPDREFVYETWLSGYLTAFNSYNPGIRDILTGTDFDDAVIWIKQYCSEHPAVVVHAATERLIQFIQEKWE
jgi:hypothetical protein